MVADFMSVVLVPNENDGAGDFGLEFPNGGVINENNLAPCSDTDSKDYLCTYSALRMRSQNETP